MWCSSGFNPGLITFLIFFNNLQLVAKFLVPIMFEDDSNLFYSNSDINEFFKNVNKEQQTLMIGVSRINSQLIRYLLK